jgi:hypothetical protein
MARPKSPKKNTDVDQSVSFSTEPAICNPTESTVEVMAAAASATEVVKARTGRAIRKPESARTESRATMVPINLNDEIRCLAYLLSERRGFEPGHETEDWLNAEREVLGRYAQQRA